MLSFADLIAGLASKQISEPEWVITGFDIDSRKVIPGSLFVALPGENVDGHDYVGHAFENGAQYALVKQPVDAEADTLDLTSFPEDVDWTALKRPVCLIVPDPLEAIQKLAAYWRNQLEIKVVGITGSVGKSTTKELVAEVVSRKFRTLKNPGNYNNEIGLPLTVLNLTRGHQAAVLEMGFYVPGEIKLLCDIARPHIGVVTNIGTVHAERAGDQETIARGKAELVESLPEDGVAILNYDDPLVRDMAGKTKAKVMYYGLSPQAHLWADEIEGLGLDGIRFRLHQGRETWYLTLPLLGRHSVHTALRASAVGLALGMEWSDILAGLRFGHNQLRLVTVRTENGALLLDDTYNASPQSTLAALDLLDELSGRKIAVLGDMLELGIYERIGHEKVGIRAADVVDRLITVGPLSKTTAQAALSIGFPEQNLTVLESTDLAIEVLKTTLQPEDVVLIKGSLGMAMHKIVRGLEVDS